MKTHFKKRIILKHILNLHSDKQSAQRCKRKRVTFCISQIQERESKALPLRQFRFRLQARFRARIRIRVRLGICGQHPFTSNNCPKQPTFGSKWPFISLFSRPNKRFETVGKAGFCKRTFAPKTHV
ncbi:hypothetical protein V6N12_074176 [Hibiscus sabdariffa]|uniref:Uncharacterized protein n=1 Tax=Hibiscus sabdariffa TaxID=183260 RepID=A0ABR2BI13_9ROSI